tara:strand:+ start:34 stop:645 length:612 start_codon:yes stop_codon:yes gene_type:complete
MYEILTIISVIFGGLLGGVVCFVLLDFETSHARLEDVRIPYENYYLLGNNKEYVKEFEKEENIKKGIVEEETPDGLVILNYNNEIERFEYWSDKIIRYKYLEVVARKYVIIYDCKDKYVNMFKELLEAMDKAKEEKNNKKKNEVNVFVNLKNYKKKDDDDEKIVNQKANIYKHMGKLIEYSVKKKEIKNIDFRTFVRNFSTSL